MPSSDRPTATRRRLLAGLGTAAAAGLAGCAGRLPGGHATAEAEAIVETNRIRWEYPPTEGDSEGIGYAAVSVEGLVRRQRLPPALRLAFNSTVGMLASGEGYEGYEPDWFRFRVEPPYGYERLNSFEVRVEPPGQWEGFSAYYDRQGVHRRFFLELRDVDTEGTILVPAVFDPGAGALPERLRCSFAVQVSRPGPLGKTVRVSGTETLEVDVG